MSISISKPAIQWFKKEFDIKGNESIRLFVKYGGCGNVTEGLSIGIKKESPIHIGISEKIEGILFFIEEGDSWFMDGKEIDIKYSRKIDEIDIKVKEK